MVRSSSWYNVWCSLIPVEMLCALHATGWRRHLGGLLAWACMGRAHGFPNPTEEALLLSEDLEPQGVQASALHVPIWLEEALKPKVTAGVVGPWILSDKYHDCHWGLNCLSRCLVHLLGRCRAPALHPQRSPAEYNLPGPHGNGYSPECPNGQVQMPLQDMAHLNDIPVAEPIWG